jgi:capsular polysaccharide export protein
MRRNFLFLQGVISPFFVRLADALAAAGHGIRRVNFCVGDLRYWRGHPADRYRGAAAGFADFLQPLLARHQVSDLVLFGDERPLHRPAIALARAAGLRVHVFEEGYLRPDWITLEEDGVNANSRLPRDPAWYRWAEHRLGAPPAARPVGASLRTRAVQDLAYHLANLANPLLFPGYRTHRPHNAALEYAGWAHRFARLPYWRRREHGRIAALLDQARPFYLLPLQLNADAQILRHSDFADMPELLDRTLDSFARHAPRDTLLIVKNHPLDTGLVNYRRRLRQLERRHGLQGRLAYLETGDLPALLRHARGVVTVNSTVGIAALQQGCPTVALGQALYALPGLTHQDGLDPFWQALPKPDPGLFRAFRNTLLHTALVNGGFYTRAGIELAVRNSLPRLTGSAPLRALLDAADSGPDVRQTRTAPLPA